MPQTMPWMEAWTGGSMILLRTAFLANSVALGSKQVSGTANNSEPTNIPATPTICTDEGSPQIAM
eukprot:1555744-Heterocapsa_arctica.AAC.1